MNINTEIWGDDTQRHTFNADNTPSRGKCKYSTVISKITDYHAEYDMTEPIDNSVNLWQIGDNSSLNYQTFMRRDGNNNLIVTQCRAPQPHAIMLTAPLYNINNNAKFNLNAGTSSTCILWDNDNNCNFPYKSASNTNNYVVTDFDYNAISARYTLFVQKHDSDGVRTGSEIQLSIHQYFFDSDANSLPYKDNYYINFMTMLLCVGDDTTRYTAFGGSYNYPPCIAFNSAFTTPLPNYYYDKNTYYNYTLFNGAYNLTWGFRQMGAATPYQQGAYGVNNNAYGGNSCGGSLWQIDEYTIGTTPYIAGRFIGAYADMLRECALVGFWFDETQLPNTSANFVIGTGCNSDNVILPEIKDGRTTGNFKRGVQAGADSQSTWGENWRDNVNYSGNKDYKDEQKNTGDLTSVFHRPTISGSCLYYNITDSELRDLIDFINVSYQPTDAQFTIDFKGTNPADYISGIIYYPTDFTCANHDIIQRGIGIGALSGLDTGVQGYIADISANNIISFSPLPIPAKFNDFRDFAPYTSLDLYIPFCGNVELDPSVFIGNTLSVQLIIDYPTGNCTGVVLCNNLVYDTINGTIGVQIPLTAQNVGSYQNAIKSAEIALKQAEIQRKTAWLSVAGSGLAVVGGIATANPLAIAGGIAGMTGGLNGVERAELAVESAQYQLTHTAPTTRTIAAASPANALCLDYDCHLLIKRATTPIGFDEAIYSHTVGNACAINAPLTDFSGLVVCADADLSGISAPAEIKTAILSALKSGVYI